MAGLALTCHPAVRCAAPGAVSASVRRTASGIAVTYVIDGNLARLRVPPPRAPRRAERLWLHTCCEMFVARPGLPGYHEFNFSPSGEWAAYAFARYREPLPGADGAPDPQIQLRSTDDRLELDAVVRFDPAGRLILGLAAVIEQDDGVLSYWALGHPPGKPDFHYRDAFTLELDEARH